MAGNELQEKIEGAIKVGQVDVKSLIRSALKPLPLGLIQLDFPRANSNSLLAERCALTRRVG